VARPAWPNNPVSRHLAHRLVHDRQTSIGVSAKLSARVRVFATGNGRKTDSVDAHSVTLAALRAPNLRRAQSDPELVALGLLIDRDDESGRARTELMSVLGLPGQVVGAATMVEYAMPKLFEQAWERFVSARGGSRRQVPARSSANTTTLVSRTVGWEDAGSTTRVGQVVWNSGGLK
jgi:hypothetical protein